MHYADWFLTADEMGNPERGLPPWSTGNAVTPLVDGSAYFSRPGPRVVDGVELLAELFDPDGFAGVGPDGGWLAVD